MVAGRTTAGRNWYVEDGLSTIQLVGMETRKAAPFLSPYESNCVLEVFPFCKDVTKGTMILL